MRMLLSLELPPIIASVFLQLNRKPSQEFHNDLKDASSQMLRMDPEHVLAFGGPADQPLGPPALTADVESFKQTGLLHAVPTASAGARQADAPATAQDSLAGQAQGVVEIGAEAPAAAPVPAVASTGPCTPQCTWQCATPKCDQVCEPKCLSPRCQTRCTGINTAGCQMQCGKRNCAVVCPKKPCPGNSCPMCFTQCSKPMCKLACPAGTQNCTDVCEDPSCSWNCKAPAVCPKPTCKMTCEPPKGCMAGGTATLNGALPPLLPGQTVIENFVTPASLLQLPAGVDGALSLQVPFTRAAAAPGRRELLLTQGITSLPVVNAR